MADELKVKVVIAGEDKLSPAAQSAARSLNHLDDATAKVGTSSKSTASAVAVLAHGLAGPVVGAATAVAAGFAYAATTAADFEKTISGLQAVTGASAEDTKQLSDLALQLGKDTSFSAREAAEGLTELAKGGVSVADTMSGAATAALNLAAAGGVSVADAAALAANAMSLFNLTGADMAKVADSIAGFANATTGSVNDFKFALASVGAAAHLAGQDFDETATAIALMGKAGILGSDSGTSLKAMLLNLQPETKKQIALFQELGLATNEVGNNFLNADGSFKDLRDIAGELNRAVGGLSESERTMALSTLFGSDAIRAAAILADAGAEGFDNMADAMSHVSAESVAAVRLDNLAGSMDSLNGSVETAAIMLGKELTPSIREVADVATQWLNTSVIPFIQEYGPGFGQQLRETVRFVGMVADALSPLIGVIGPALRAQFDSWGQGLDFTIDMIYKTVVAIVTIKNTIGEFFDTLGTKAHEVLDALPGMISNLGPTLKNAALGLGGQMVAGIVEGLNPAAVVEKMKNIAGDAIQAGADAIRAHSPSEETEEKIGIPMVHGIIAGLEHEAPALYGAVDALAAGVIQRMAPLRQPLGAQATPDFGSNPAAMDLLRANGYLNGQSGGALGSTVDIAGLLNTMARERGRGAKERPAHRTAIEGFHRGVEDLVTDSALHDKLGDLGTTAWGALTEALETGAYGAGSKAGNAMQRVVEAARKAGVPDWEQLGKDLMGAFETAITTGSQAARDRVSELLAMANQALQAAQTIKDVGGSASSGKTAAGTPMLDTAHDTSHTPFVYPGDAKLPRFATGGAFTVGGRGGVDSSLVQFMASPGERVSVAPPGGNGNGAAPVVIDNTITLDGQVLYRAMRTYEGRASEQTLTYPSGYNLRQNGVGGVGGGGF